MRLGGHPPFHLTYHTPYYQTEGNSLLHGGAKHVTSIGAFS